MKCIYSILKLGGEMKCTKLLVLCLVFFTFLVGCNQQQPLDDPDNAIVSGYVYKTAIPTDSVIDSVVVDTLGIPTDTIWAYIDWAYSNPAENVHVWVESDLCSEIPYVGPDIDGYTDSTGFYSVPIYLGHTAVKACGGDITGYEYVYFADVRVFVLYTSFMYDFGGGITLGRAREFRLPTIALNWQSNNK